MSQDQSWAVANSPGPVVESVRRVPPPPLRPLVAWYSGYRQAGLRPARHRGLPSPYLTVIITLDEPLCVAAHPDPRQPPGEFTTLVGGLHTSPAVITHQGSQSGIQLGLTPLGARALFGMPASELAGIDVCGSDVLGAVAAKWQGRLREAATWPERFAILDESLRRQADRDAAIPAELTHAWARLLATGGAVSIADLASEVGRSPRHLGGRFRAEIGFGPKAAARMVRFHRARILLQRRVGSGRPASLADLAAACGYYDQAHLAREFRALAGCPPSQWLAEEFRYVQAHAIGAEEGL